MQKVNKNLKKNYEFCFVVDNAKNTAKNPEIELENNLGVFDVSSDATSGTRHSRSTSGRSITSMLDN